MRRSEEEFFRFNTRKVVYIIDRYYGDYKEAVEKQEREVSSMREFLKR